MNTFFIKTFGCQQNTADSERITSYYEARGLTQVETAAEADVVVINTCMIREKAEERVYGYIRNLRAEKSAEAQKIIMTGCIVGAAAREPSGKMRKKLEKRIPDVELLPLEEVGFEYMQKRPPQNAKKHAWVVISNGCNNYCAFCIVPFSRGKEVSRPFADIVAEVQQLAEEGYESITLLGQNVNSYGADLVQAQKVTAKKPSPLTPLAKGEEGSVAGSYALPDGRTVAPVMVEHLGRYRIPTLFPYLLEAVCAVPGIVKVSFISANPWDFSDALIDVIARNENVERLIHLPVQAGSDRILKKMNRWYTREQYMALIDRIRAKVPGVAFTTDVIVGFPSETEEDFHETLDLMEQVGFVQVFAACYSPRPGTAATKAMEDNLSWEEKKRRFRILDEAVNQKQKERFEANWL